MESILSDLIYRQVTVQVGGGLKVSGRLLCFSEAQRKPDHKPLVLLLWTSEGPCLVRDWSVISFDGGPRA